jgi:hypothetical protein
MKKLLQTTLIIETLFIILLSLLGFIIWQEKEIINQLWQTNQEACSWILDNGMEAPEHCNPYL